MRFFDGAAVDAALSYPALIDILDAAFVKGAIAPLRHHHASCARRPARGDAAADAGLGGKRAGRRHCRPLHRRQVGDGVSRQRHAQQAGRVRHLSADVGRERRDRSRSWMRPASPPGARLAASALASRYLSRPDASRLLMVGAGALAPFLVRAHASVRPIREVAIWNRTRGRAEAVVAELARHGIGCVRRRRPGSRRAPGRHRLDRHPVLRPADPRRVADARHASRLRRRVPAEHARDRRRGGAPRPHLRRHARRRIRRGRRHPAADRGRRDRQGRGAGRPVRPDARRDGRPRCATATSRSSSRSAPPSKTSPPPSRCTRAA